MSKQAATFWEHLDVLRWTIIRSLAVVVAFAVAAFCMKDWLFTVILAPSSSDFVTFRWIGGEPFSIHLINTALTEQFMTHMRTAAYAGLLCASPYVLYELFRFPAHDGLGIPRPGRCRRPGIPGPSAFPPARSYCCRRCRSYESARLQNP